MVNIESNVGYICTTERCNTICAHCLLDLGIDKKDSVSLSQVQEYIDIIKPDVVVVSGGEPTLHPDIDKILKKCNDSHTILISNAMVFNKFESTKRKLEHLFEVGLNSLCISIGFQNGYFGENPNPVPIENISNVMLSYIDILPKKGSLFLKMSLPKNSIEVNDEIESIFKSISESSSFSIEKDNLAKFVKNGNNIPVVLEEGSVGLLKLGRAKKLSQEYFEYEDLEGLLESSCCFDEPCLFPGRISCSSGVFYVKIDNSIQNAIKDYKNSDFLIAAKQSMNEVVGLVGHYPTGKYSSPCEICSELWQKYKQF